MIEKMYNLFKEKYGNDAQMIKAIEELSELQKALSKYLLGEQDGKNIIEEIADVEIMTEQLKLMFDCHKKVEIVKKQKIDRCLKKFYGNLLYVIR